MRLTIRSAPAGSGTLRLSVAGYAVSISDLDCAEVRLSTDAEGALLEVLPLDRPLPSERIETVEVTQISVATPPRIPTPLPAQAPAPARVYPEDPALFKKLVTLRKQIASELDRPAYMVFQDRCLKDMIALRPDNLQTLSSIPSIGASRAKRHGARFLNLLIAHGTPEL
jgi:superfamily II DNA helicase RecQ